MAMMPSALGNQKKDLAAWRRLLDGNIEIVEEDVRNKGRSAIVKVNIRIDRIVAIKDRSRLKKRDRDVLNEAVVIFSEMFGRPQPIRAN